MAHYFKVCDICYAHVDEHHLIDHKHWHRTLSNMPMEVPRERLEQREQG